MKSIQNRIKHLWTRLNWILEAKEKNYSPLVYRGIMWSEKSTMGFQTAFYRDL